MFVPASSTYCTRQPLGTIGPWNLQKLSEEGSLNRKAALRKSHIAVATPEGQATLIARRPARQVRLIARVRPLQRRSRLGEMNLGAGRCSATCADEDAVRGKIGDSVASSPPRRVGDTAREEDWLPRSGNGPRMVLAVRTADRRLAAQTLDEPEPPVEHDEHERRPSAASSPTAVKGPQGRVRPLSATATDP